MDFKVTVYLLLIYSIFV